MSSMSEMTSKVLGPEEQPRSAMPMLSVEVEHKVLTMASLVAALDNKIMVFYVEQQKLYYRYINNYDNFFLKRSD